MRETLGLWRAAWLSPGWWVRKEYQVLTTDLSAIDTTELQRGVRARPRWAVLSAADIPALLGANTKLSASELRRRWDEGQQCTGAWIGDVLAHYRWDTIRRSILPYLGCTFEPAPGDTLVWEAHTRREYRGQGLHSLSTARAFEEARARGLARSITLVAWWNAPALRVVQEKGRRTRAGSVGYWQLPVGRRYFATGSVRLGSGRTVSVDVRERPA